MAYNKNMMIVDLVEKISEGNPGALEVCAALIMDPRPTAFMHLLAFDDQDIRGGNIWTLYKDCCHQNKDNLCATMRMLQFGLLSSEEIKANLARLTPLSFVDDISKLKGYLSERDEIINMSEFKVSLEQMAARYRLAEQQYIESQTQMGGEN